MLHGIPKNTMEHGKQIMKQFSIATIGHTKEDISPRNNLLYLGIKHIKV